MTTMWPFLMIGPNSRSVFGVHCPSTKARELWYALEQPATFLRFLDELYDGRPAWDELVNRYRPQLVRALKSRTSSHLKADTAFLAQVLLGEMWKVRNGDAELQVTSLPQSRAIYCVPMRSSPGPGV